MYIAHKRENGDKQSLRTHLEETAELAKEFANEFDAGEYGYLAGLSHDIGKYSSEFQNYISGIGGKTEHSAASASELMKIMSGTSAAYMLSYCTSGHHSGIPDGGTPMDTYADATLEGKLKRQEQKGADYSAYSSEINLEKYKKLNDLNPPLKPAEFRDKFALSLYTRMIYSSLTDADFLNSEKFMKSDSVVRSSGDDMQTLLGKFDEHMKENFSQPKNEIYKKRNEILEMSNNAAVSKKGLFSMTVPTGGGKTLSSMSFALRHAVKNNMRRIIYVIPYTSIIEQTAEIFSKIFGEKNVLAHYSTVSYDYLDEEIRSDMETRKKLASENWDCPIVITTNVQFFESFFANRSSKCRKLHNTANSVVIFDEAQMFPSDYLIPCVRVIASLVLNFRSTAVLCTATRPCLDEHFTGMQIKEICDNTDELYSFFKRTRIKNSGKKAFDELADEINSCNQVLCIVNTKIHARKLYEKIAEMNPDSDGIYHLSTNLCPHSRKEIMKSIRLRLDDKSNPVCRVIATSLVEAGVDFDFPVVYREKAGIDSIVQAAGRCNREGERNIDESIVHVFTPDDIYKGKLHTNLIRPIEVSDMVWKNNIDPSEPEIIEKYFNLLHRISGDSLDKKKIVKRLNVNPPNFPFASIANEFKLIETAEKSIFIPLDEEAKQLAESLRSGQINRETMRKLGAYTVNVYPYQYAKLYEAGVLETSDGKNESISILSDMSKYNEKTGLDIPDTGTGSFI